MESDTMRRIKSGKEFDHLFPPPNGNDTRVKGRADVEDTLKLIRKTVPLTLWHTEKISKRLKGRTLDETCSNIWHFVYEHIQYKKDKDGVEQVRSPRRTWWERKTGVDCDCYTEFISSILLNLDIPHRARITKYPKPRPQVPRWQHIYPIVPKDGRLDYDLEDRDSYIVLDCVKDEYDSEQPFLECKDYDMKLDYLDGIDEELAESQGDFDWPEPDNVDAADLQTMDEELLGNIFKKIGKGIKKAASKVGSGVKTAVKKVGTVVKKVGDKVGDGIRFVNRYINPATILVRNGFLLIMKNNIKGWAKKLRHAYLTDEQAKQRGMNLASLKDLRKIKDRAETIYWQVGGKKSNLKKAILKGKGNKDKTVPLSGLFGLDDNVYMDLDEYNIIHSDTDDLEGLGELVSGTAIAAAMAAATAVGAALKQIKGLFSKDQDQKDFESEGDAGSEATVPTVIPEDEDKMVEEYDAPAQASSSTQSQAYTPAQKQTTTITKTETPYETAEYSDAETTSESDQSQLPGASALTRRVPAGSPATTESATTPATTNSTKTEGFVEKTTAWVKTNPGTSLLIASAVAGGGFLLVKALQGSNNNNNNKKKNSSGMNGLPNKNKTKRKKKDSKNKIQSITL